MRPAKMKVCYGPGQSESIEKTVAERTHELFVNETQVKSTRCVSGETEERMESPQMYDTQHNGQGNGVMSADMKNDLNTPEISLDLQNLIDDSQFNEGLFTDILQNPAMGKQLHSLQTANRTVNHVSASGNYLSSTLAYMPQPVHSGAGANYTRGGNCQAGTNSDSNSSIASDAPSIKEEPVDPQEYRRQCAAVLPGGGYMPGYAAAVAAGNPSFAPLTPGGVLHHPHHQSLALGGGQGMKGLRPGNGGLGHPHHHQQQGNGARKSMKPTDKSSDEYRRRRERNNIAVRKSREKAKVRTRETEEKVKLLVKENERLQKRIELLTEELNVLRSLFSNVGVLPEHLHREINKHLDSFQLQHQQQQQHMSEDRRVMDILQEYGP
ncbi:slow border cells [Carabus blaptoides fortunei]